MLFGLDLRKTHENKMITELDLQWNHHATFVNVDKIVVLNYQNNLDDNY